MGVKTALCEWETEWTGARSSVKGLEAWTGRPGGSGTEAQQGCVGRCHPAGPEAQAGDSLIDGVGQLHLHGGVVEPWSPRDGSGGGGSQQPSSGTSFKPARAPELAGSGTGQTTRRCLAGSVGRGWRQPGWAGEASSACSSQVGSGGPSSRTRARLVASGPECLGTVWSGARTEALPPSPLLIFYEGLPPCHASPTTTTSPHLQHPALSSEGVSMEGPGSPPTVHCPPGDVPCSRNVGHLHRSRLPLPVPQAARGCPLSPLPPLGLPPCPLLRPLLTGMDRRRYQTGTGLRLLCLL